MRGLLGKGRHGFQEITKTVAAKNGKYHRTSSRLSSFQDYNQLVFFPIFQSLYKQKRMESWYFFLTITQMFRPFTYIRMLLPVHIIIHPITFHPTSHSYFCNAVPKSLYQLILSITFTCFLIYKNKRSSSICSSASNSAGKLPIPSKFLWNKEIIFHMAPLYPIWYI